MINIKIPGMELIEINNIVFDFNGTIAVDGTISKEVKNKIGSLVNENLNVYILTSDTYGTVLGQCKDMSVKIEVFSKENASVDKLNFIKKIGPLNTIAIGNGNNDAGMFNESVLSIAVIGREGCASKALISADILVCDIMDAFDMIQKPDRLKATLRT